MIDIAFSRTIPQRTEQAGLPWRVRSMSRCLPMCAFCDGLDGREYVLGGEDGV